MSVKQISNNGNPFLRNVLYLQGYNTRYYSVLYTIIVIHNETTSDYIEIKSVNYRRVT